MKFSVNTDSVDIDNKQIGIHFQGTMGREFCAGVNHKGTRESVEKATEIARLFAAAPEMFNLLGEIRESGPNACHNMELLIRISEVISKARG